MILKSLRHKSLIFLALASLSLGSCINDSASECLEQDRSKSVVLRLALNGAGSDATRAEKGEPDWYDPATGSFETISQLRVIIVRLNDAKTGGIVEANRMVRTSDTGTPLNDNLEFLVVAEENKRVYLIANEAFLPVPDAVKDKYRTASIFLDTFKGTSPDKEGSPIDLSVFSNWTVTMPDVTAATQTVKKGLFSPSEATRLPLTEYFDLFVTRENAVDDIYHANMFLTRAAAKAQFFISTETSGNFDDTDDDPKIINSKITAITLEGISTTEYVFPNAAIYKPSKEDLMKLELKDLKEAYITSFKAPQPNQKVTYLIEVMDQEIKKPATPETGAAAPTPITGTIYFPESILGSGEKFKVRVQLDGQNWIEGELDTNILNMAGVDAIARDTYLPIHLIFNGAGQFRLEVLPWNPEYYEFDFSNHVGMSDDGALSFIETTYPTGGLDKTTARLVLPEYPSAVSGSFTIGSPVGHRWDAYIVTTKGEQNAIQFVVKDAGGNDVYTDHLTGKVGDLVNFKVAATMSAGNEQREAIMQVIATLDYGGISVPVNVLEGGNYGDGTENITFIQNAR